MGAVMVAIDEGLRDRTWPLKHMKGTEQKKCRGLYTVETDWNEYNIFLRIPSREL